MEIFLSVLSFLRLGGGAAVDYATLGSFSAGSCVLALFFSTRCKFVLMILLMCWLCCRSTCKYCFFLWRSLTVSSTCSPPLALLNGY